VEGVGHLCGDADAIKNSAGEACYGLRIASANENGLVVDLPVNLGKGMRFCGCGRLNSSLGKGESGREGGTQEEDAKDAHNESMHILPPPCEFSMKSNASCRTFLGNVLRRKMVLSAG
jgi:hypothetical protein